MAQGVQPNHPEPREKEFLQEQHDSSYLRLPIPQGGMRGRICWWCGDTGHIRNTCNQQVLCTFCQVYSHATKACKKYVSFVRNNQGTSSKRMTPIQNLGDVLGYNQMPQPQVPTGLHGPTGDYPCFQLPVVPPVIHPSHHQRQTTQKKK